MSIKYGPKISANGLVLSLDADNSKSYSGVGNTNTWYDLSGIGNTATRTNNPGYGGQVTFNPSGYFDFTVNPFAGATNFGYFGGGTPGPVSTVDRIDYSNDTATASVKGPLSLARYLLAATGNSSYGYFGGGNSPSQSPSQVSTVDRIDYSNDTATASPKGPLSTTKLYLAATGNISYGYFGGGQNPSGIISTVDRIDYSNDTATASPKGPLSLARYLLAATGNSSYGYFGVGIWPYTSTVDRIDYTNDTVTASVKGPLSSARYNLAATGNSSFGYFGGGRNVTNPIVSTVDRIDYSNDTATSSVKGPLSSVKYQLAATGNSSFGYFGGGTPFPATSTVDRIDYSNDTATASVKGPLSFARYHLAAASPKANAIVLDASLSGNGFTLSSVTVPTTGGFSISAFIKRDTSARELSDIETIFSNGIGDGWFFGINASGNLYYAISCASGVGSQEGSLGGNVADAEWHMVTVVFDRAADLGSYKVYGYVDGSESGTAIISAGSGGNVSFTSTAPGVGYGGFYNVFGGEISNIYSWNRVLTASEVLENYNELKPKYEFL